MHLPTKSITQLERFAGHPALDFANTVSWRGLPAAVEYLQDYPALVDWSRTEGLLQPRESARLVRTGAREPRRAAAALARALALRDTVFGIGTALARGVAPARRLVQRLHTARVAALSQARPERVGPAVWAASWSGAATNLDRPWWPVAESFAAFLEHPSPYPLGICPGCSWLFLDSSRNRSRRWCSSTDCGNRERGQRFRDRQAAP